MNNNSVTKGFHTNIEEKTLGNDNFRKVLFTANHSQLVLMTLNTGEEIGLEVHSENDQFFRFEEGEGRIIISNEEYTVRDGDAVIVPSGAKHNVINTSTTKKLKFYTIYSPKHHSDGTIHITKAEADKAEKLEHE